MTYITKLGDNIVKNRTIVFLAAILLSVSGGLFADDEKKQVMTIEVAGDDMSEGVKFRLDTDELGFDLEEMQVGEARSVIDEAGRSVLITRSETGFSFSIDGKTIEMPYFGDFDREDINWVTAPGDVAANVHVMRRHGRGTLSDIDGTVIISPKPIDEATKTSIQSILEAAGYGSEVEFIDHAAASDGHVFIKKIETAGETTL